GHQETVGTKVMVVANFVLVEVNGWPKRALLEARDETLEKKKQISELIVTVNFFHMELKHQKVGKRGCSNGDEENKRL
ncbi:hypothetical protein HID58_088642, partial [Brassica napus]